MVIDDDNIMVKLLQKQLGTAGHKFIGNLSRDGAMKCLQMETPDLIILDLVFEDTDGFEIAREIRAREETKKTPIILITATLSVKSDKGKTQIDIDGEKFLIFAKPLHIPKLLSTIRKTLNRIQNS